jgi:hypothetical protein
LQLLKDILNENSALNGFENFTKEKQKNVADFSLITISKDIELFITKFQKEFTTRTYSHSKIDKLIYNKLSDTKYSLDYKICGIKVTPITTYILNKKTKDLMGTLKNEISLAISLIYPTVKSPAKEIKYQS